jgi:predicted hydrocarbon binding protein
MVTAEVGQPRIVRSIPNLMRLRLDGCRGCAEAARQEPSAPGIDGCAFECGLLETSLSKLLRSEVIVHEVTCRGRGAPACDFEVWY